ncbi:MAG TPA: hypothetical protein VH080_10130, partial [Gemmatimonadaceae bacterium]|jgi:hypothetical protein|nr:hypothetical protein [Gemmatimonadaceae bacterium]
LIVLCTSRDREHGGDESQALHADLLRGVQDFETFSALAAAMLGSIQAACKLPVTAMLSRSQPNVK